ncbi:MAG: MaoC family dehydratase N-terminal domain-containing protein [Phycicoccus sp.]|nr:MaoC family dehydratase N-terminal domain-containing protein [Phycicoccus sp.]
MSVNLDFVGQTYPPAGPFQVSAADIAAFAAAVGATDPIHTDADAARAAGYPDVVAPPTLAVKYEQQAQQVYVADPAAGIDFSRVVHGEESFTHHRPIVAGDQLTAGVVVDAIRQAGGHSMITLRVELSDAAGAPVTSCLSTLVVRGGE